MVWGKFFLRPVSSLFFGRKFFFVTRTHSYQCTFSVSTVKTTRSSRAINPVPFSPIHYAYIPLKRIIPLFVRLRFQCDISKKKTHARARSSDDSASLPGKGREKNVRQFFCNLTASNNFSLRLPNNTVKRVWPCVNYIVGGASLRVETHFFCFSTARSRTLRRYINSDILCTHTHTLALRTTTCSNTLDKYKFHWRNGVRYYTSW